MERILLVLSVLALLGGFFFISEATLGVGIIAAAGVMGILARIIQANRHQDEQLGQLDQIRQKVRNMENK